MPTAFDDLIPASPRKPTATAFDDLIPNKAASVPAPIGDRSWGDVAGDAIASLAGGGNQLLQTGNWAIDKLTGPIADDFFASNAKKLIADRQAIQEFKSPQQQYAEAQVSGAKGVSGVVNALVHNPAAAANFVGEQLPMFGVLGKGMQVARGAATGAQAVGRMMAANVGTGTVLGAGDAATGAQADAWAQGQSDDVARDAGNTAAMVAAPISALASLLGAGAESRIAGKVLGDQVTKLTAGQAAKQMLGLAGKEVAEEALDEGGTQFAQNYGAQSTYNPSQDLWQGVPEAATLGGVLGLGMGGTMNAFEAVHDYRHQPQAPAPQITPDQAANTFTEALAALSRNGAPQGQTVTIDGETVTPQSTALTVPAQTGEYIPASEPIQERGPEVAAQPLNRGGVWEAGDQGVREQTTQQTPQADTGPQLTPQLEDKSNVLYAGQNGISNDIAAAAQSPNKVEIGKQQTIQKNALATMRTIEAKHGDVVAKMPSSAKAQYTKAQNAYLAASEQLQQLGAVDPSITPQQGVSSPRMNLRDDQLAGQIADTRERAATMLQPFKLETIPAQSEDTPEGHRSTGSESNELNKDTQSNDAQQSAALSTWPIQAEVQVDTRVRDDRSAGDQAITSPAADQPGRSQPDQNGNELLTNVSSNKAESEPSLAAKPKTQAGTYDGDPVYHDGLGNVYRTIEHRGKQIKDYLTDQERAEIQPPESQNAQLSDNTHHGYTQESQSSRNSEEDTQVKASKPEKVLRSGLSAAKLQAAIDKAMVGVHNATVRVVQTAEEGARIAGDSAESIKSGSVEGFYQPTTGEIVLIADSISTVSRGVWVLAHELLHRGIEGNLGQSLFKLLAEAETNPTVKRLAKAIARERKLKNDLFDRLLSVEEALAELNAARQTNSYTGLLVRYGVNVPLNMRQGLAAQVGALLDRFKAWLARFTGQPANTFSNQEVLDLLDGAMDWVRNGNQIEKEVSGDAKLSISDELGRYERTVDAVVSGGIFSKQPIKIGATPDVLQALGAPDLPLSIQPNDLHKAYIKHRLDAELLKQIPDALHDPVMVFDSKTEPGALVVLTELHSKEGKPIVAAVHINKRSSNIQVNEVASIHGKDAGVKAIQAWIDAGLLRYLKNESALKETSSHPLYLRQEGIHQSAESRILTERDIVKGNPTERGALKSTAPKQKNFGLGRDRAGDLTVGVTDAGYEAFASAVGVLMDKTIGRVFGKVSAMSPELRKQLRQFKLDQAKAERTAQSVADAGKDITLDDAKLLSDFIENELQSGVVPPEHVKQMATAMRAALAQQGKDLVELGMLSQETVDRLGENYLPRLYTRQAKKLTEYLPEVLRRGVDGGRMKMRGKKMLVPADQVQSYEALGWRKVADAKGGNVVMNRDWTREERAQMGENRDARTRFVLGYLQTQRDLALGQLFRRISQDSDLTSDTPLDGWVQMPATRDSETGISKYGQLAGKYVSPEVNEHLEYMMREQNDAMRLYRKAVGLWKEGKTALNPASHMNNIIGNMHMSLAAGAGPIMWKRAADQIRKGGKYYQEAIDGGLLGNEGNHELAEMIGQMRKGTSFMDAQKGPFALWFDAIYQSKPALPLRVIGFIGSKIRQGMNFAYGQEDAIFKLALYMKAREGGADENTAMDYAETFVFNYADLPKGVRMIRDHGLPFFSFTSKAIPAATRLAMTKPHRVAAIVGAWYAVNALSYLMMGGDADEGEERSAMNDQMNGYSLWGIPRNIRIPKNDENGAAMFLDIYRYMPLGDFMEMREQSKAGGDLPSWMQPGGPLYGLFATYMMNRDTFTGKEITSEGDELLGEAAKKRAMSVWSQWAPNMPFVPGSYYFNRLANGAVNEFADTPLSDALIAAGYSGENRWGDPEKLGDAALGSVGVKLRRVDVAEGLQRKQFDKAQEARKMNEEIRRVNRDQSIPDEARAKKVKELVERRDELIKRMD